MAIKAVYVMVVKFTVAYGAKGLRSSFKNNAHCHLPAQAEIKPLSRLFLLLQSSAGSVPLPAGLRTGGVTTAQTDSAAGPASHVQLKIALSPSTCLDRASSMLVKPIGLPAFVTDHYVHWCCSCQGPQ